MVDVAEASEESAQAVAVRAEVRAWLEEHWRPGRSAAEWRATVVDAGWACPSWPTQWYGRGLPAELTRAVMEEFDRVGAHGTGQDLSNLAGNTVLAYGTDDLKRRVLRPLLLGEITTCLLYSEPGAGSDLAAVQTRADRDGDEWVVNGQKVWTSGAHRADYGLLIARTDWDAPKHQGITYFFFPMKQAGVEVRPIKQMTGEANFNEVFFTDARVPDGNVVGDLNDGWRVLQTALAYERLVMGRSRGASASTPGAPTDGAARASEESIESSTVEGGTDFVALARATGKSTDPVIRQAIAELVTLRRVNRWNTLRGRASMAQGTSSPLASLGKLAMSRILHSSARLNSFMLGPEAMRYGNDAPTADAVNRAAMVAYVNSIGGGSDQIQRNIIAERILGLPKEPEPDRGKAFRDVRKAEATRQFS